MATTSDQAVTMQDAYERIKDIEVVVVDPNSTRSFGSLWNDNERCVLFFARHMG